MIWKVWAVTATVAFLLAFFWNWDAALLVWLFYQL